MSKKNDPHPVDVYVGKRIREARLSKGLTQAELAKRVGYRHQQFHKYEYGVNAVRAGLLWDISKVLGRSVPWFYEGYEDGAPPDAGEAPFNLSAIHLAGLIQQIRDEEVKNGLSGLIRAYVEEYIKEREEEEEEEKYIKEQEEREEEEEEEESDD